MLREVANLLDQEVKTQNMIFSHRAYLSRKDRSPKIVGESAKAHTVGSL